MHILKSQSVLLTTVSVVSLLLGGCLNTGQLSSASSCSALGPCSTAGGGGGGGGGGTGGGSSTTSSSPFKLTLTSYWYGDTNKTQPKTHTLYEMSGDTASTINQNSPCTISSNTIPALPTNYSSAIKTCGVEISETQLAYSSLQFDVEVPAYSDPTDIKSCDVVYMQPYFYLASRSKAFLPPWMTTPLDCWTLTNGFPNKSCYTGPAVDLIPGFPRTFMDINPISDKSVSFKKSWTAKSSLEAYNMGFDEANKWTSFNPNFFTTSGAAALGTPGLPVTWAFNCVQKGSSRSYQYTVRIFPKKDSPFYSGAPRRYGWLDDSGNEIGKASNFTFTPTEGPLDGGTVLTILGTTVETSSAVILETADIQGSCTIDTTANQNCTLPSFWAGSSVDSDATVIVSNQNAPITVATVPFEFKALQITSVSPNNGAAAGGTTVTVSGHGIAKNATVSIGGVSCTVVASSWENDGTSIQCTTGAKAASTGNNVVVTNPTSAQTNTLAGGFTYN